MLQKKQLGKDILRMILSIILASIGGFLTFIALIYLFFYVGLFGWADGGEKQYLKRLELTTNITLIFSVIAALIVFIVIFVKVNKKRPGNYSDTISN